MEDGKTGGQSGDTGDQKVKVGEKEYSAQDVQNLISQAGANEDKIKSVSKILEAAKSYGLSPDEFLGQAVAGFEVVSGLMNRGVIDNEGNLIEKGNKETKTSKKTTGDPELDKFFNLDEDGDKGGTQGNKTEAIVAQALNSIKGDIGKLTSEVGKMRDVQTSIIERNFRGEIKSRFSSLDDRDVSEVFARARGDRTKDLYAHAQDLADAKVAREVEITKKFAKDHNLNYEELTRKKENDLNEPGPEGGAAAFLPEKKISFRPGAGDDTITPMEAAQAFLKAKAQEE